MRTTVELTDAHRARLLALAAERGEKGFSSIVQEALDRYLAEIDAAEREAELRRGLAAIGSLSEEVAERMEATMKRLRSTWR
jgi:metal-responsive CopG/Arc/MetJ family transcriptional regulator